MEILINGNAADITLESEKTVGDVIAGLENWISGSGHRLSGISIDGKNVLLSSIDEIFSADLKKFKVIDIHTSSITDLTIESFANLINDAKEFDSLDFNEKNKYLDRWNEKPQALFAKEQNLDLYNLYVNAFSGGEVNTGMLISVTEERTREVIDPAAEIVSIKKIVEDICTRLNDLALDMQTGKDARAAQSIQAFTGAAEKLLRIIHQLEIQGYLESAEESIKSIISEFGKLIKDFLDAYERHDTVLVGDIAEYEASVKLQELYDSVLNTVQERK